MKKDMANDKTKLRSPKIRNIIRENPPILLRWGTTFIMLIFILLILFVCFLKYPYSMSETILQHFVRMFFS